MPESRAREPSPYEVLEVPADASSQDITRAYRRRARAWHPDAHPLGAGAAAQFQAVSDAYELLSDPGRRAAYDERQHPPAAERTRPAVSESAVRGPAAPFLSSPPPPLWPLGPATTDAVAPPRAASAGGELRPGPVRVEPLPGTPLADRGSAPRASAGLASVDYVSAEVRLLLLTQIARDNRDHPW